MTEQTKILVVEDEGVVARELQTRLQRMGYDVPLPINSGKAAIETAQKFRPEIVLIDIRLKGEMDGIDVAAKVTEQYGTPVIFLTDTIDEMTLKRAEQAQPSAFLLEPYDECKLHCAIQVAIERHHAEMARCRSERWLAGALRSIADAVIAVDNDRRVLFLNPMAQSLTGWSEAEAEGRALSEVLSLVDEASGHSLEPSLDNAAGEAILVARNGTRIPVEENAAPILNEGGQVAGGVQVFRDITQRKHAEAAREANERQLRVLADSMSHLAWTAEPDGRISWCNQRWNEYTGVPAEDLRDGDWVSLVGPQQAKQAAKRWQQSLETGTMFEMEFPLRRADGAWRWFLTRAMPVNGQDGNIVTWFGTHTEIHEALETLHSLKRANVNLAQFAYTASHDLREPLRNVLLYSELLNAHYAPALDAKGAEFLDIITSGARRMDQLVRDLLIYAETANVLEGPLETVDSSQTLAEVVAQLPPSAGDAVITSGSLPKLRMRQPHLRQLLQTLVENALQYRSERKPKVHINAEAQGAVWIFSVQDNGIGIDPAYRETIFGLFTRLQTPQQSPGTGLGLALCRNIVQLYRGRIWVESEVGVGSTFCFALPR